MAVVPPDFFVINYEPKYNLNLRNYFPILIDNHVNISVSKKYC